MSIYKQGNSKPVSISLYEPHIEVINDAILNSGYQSPAHFVQTLVEDYDNRERHVFKNFVFYLLYPFLIIFFLILYAFASGNVWLSIPGGIMTSIFWYFVYIYTLKSKGIDPRTHFKAKKKRKRVKGE